MTDIFKQGRPPIDPNEFDQGGTDDEAGVESMRSMLHGGVQASASQEVPQGPPPPVVMMGNVPPQVQAAMNQPQFANHPLKQQAAPPQQVASHQDVQNPFQQQLSQQGFRQQPQQQQVTPPNLFQQPSFQQPQQTQQFQQPSTEHNDLEFPQAMSEASQMYNNARKLMKQQQNPQQQQPVQQFNPNFNPTQLAQQSQYSEFKDPRYEAIIKQLSTVQYEEIELPSKGRFYLRGEGPSNGILHVRKMTGQEESILYTPRYVKKNQSLNMIFKECIGEQINPELLLSEDRTYLLIYLRGISHSPIYDVEVKCPECQKTSQQHLPLNDLEVDYCPDDFGPEDLFDSLPNSGLNIRYRLSTGRDETATQEHKDARIKQWGAEVADDTALFRAALLVEEVNGINNKIMIQNIVSRLPIGDMAYLRELLNEPPFGVNSKVGIICPHCSHEFQVELPMEISFFFPKPILQRKKKQRA